MAHQHIKGHLWPNTCTVMGQWTTIHHVASNAACLLFTNCQYSL